MLFRQTQQNAITKFANGFFAMEFCRIDSSLAAKTFLFSFNPQKRHTEVWIFYGEIQKVYICTCDTDQRIL